MLMKIDPMRHFEGLASAMLSDSYPIFRNPPRNMAN